ncbi:ASCH domain-containing protein [Xenorhabdus bovienii]|uniref:ASCH domain-containing protein n=2 Tax=Xenorhabdus bovienii TaxID=40576 RepID=UPI0023B25614|nr:ASCH domain-containing protein [Xenorhabdus bovienii]
MKIHELMEVIENKYPAAESWVFGDSIEMYDKLSALVAEGTKTATSCSYHAYKQVDEEIEIGNEYIVLNGKNLPVCVVRVTAVHLTQFSAMTTELAWKEGEGDRSLHRWRMEHKCFFEREGTFSPDMEVVVIEFEVIEVL